MPAVLNLLSLLWFALTAPLSLVLLVVAETWTGRAFAVAGLALGVAPRLAAPWSRKVCPARRKAAYVLATLGAAIFAVLVALAPDGRAAPSARVRHLATGETWQFHRFALGNLLPEVDQLMLGFTLMPLLDPLLTQAQASGLKKWTAEVYRELEADPEFHALGSAMPDVYAALRGQRPRGHAFLYVPSTVDRTKPAPVLVFFHGSGGAWKAYLWILSRVADRLGAVLIAPSYGTGNWSSTDAPAILQSALSAASATVQLDRARLSAIGLSNGGLAVSQLLATSSLDVEALVFVSPVFDSSRFSSPTTTARPRHPSALVLTGGTDNRVPPDYVTEAVAQLRKAGRPVEFEVFDDANHFLYFSHRDQLQVRLEKFLTRQTYVK